MKQKKKTGKPLQEMSFFELSVISIMPHDIFKEIKDRISLALNFLEDGAVNTSMDILRKFLGGHNET